MPQKRQQMQCRLDRGTACAGAASAAAAAGWLPLDGRRWVAVGRTGERLDLAATR